MFSNPELDLYITKLLISGIIIISLGIFFISKKRFLSLIVFSCGANSILLLDVLLGSDLFFVYDIFWLAQFSLFIWPIINIFLIIQYSKQSNK